MAVNVEMLKEESKKRGMSIEDVAKKAGIDRATMYRRLQNEGKKFTVCEAQKIAEAIDLSREQAVAIFFAEKLA